MTKPAPLTVVFGPAEEAPRPTPIADQDNEAFQRLTNEMYAMKKELDRMKWLKNVQEDEWAEDDQEGYVLNEDEIDAAARAGGYEVGEENESEEEDEGTPRGNGGQPGTTGAFTAPATGGPPKGGEPGPTGTFTAPAAGGPPHPPGLIPGGPNPASPAPIRVPTSAGPGPLGPHPPGLPDDAFHRAYISAASAAVGTQGAAAALGITPQIVGSDARMTAGLGPGATGMPPGSGPPPGGGRPPMPLGCGYAPREACDSIGLRVANPVQGDATDSQVTITLETQYWQPQPQVTDWGVNRMVPSPSQLHPLWT